MQLAYAICVSEPVSILIDTSGTGRVPESTLVELIREHFGLSPQGIMESLKLRRPIYRRTAAYGHFGREDDIFTWEQTDRAQSLRAKAGV